MLIFFGNFGGARHWWIGPLIALLPLLLNSGLLGAPLHLLSLLVRAAARRRRPPGALPQGAVHSPLG